MKNKFALVLLVIVTALTGCIIVYLPQPSPLVTVPLATNADYSIWLTTNAPPRPPNPYVQYSPSAPGYWYLPPTTTQWISK